MLMFCELTQIKVLLINLLKIRVTWDLTNFDIPKTVEAGHRNTVRIRKSAKIDCSSIGTLRTSINVNCNV